jgi:hypothetical protein
VLSGIVAGLVEVADVGDDGIVGCLIVARHSVPGARETIRRARDAASRPG